MYTITSGKNTGIFLGALDSKQPKRLFADESQAAYYDDHVLFVRDGTLMAQRVDARTMAFLGDLFPVAERISDSVNGGEKLFTVSENGILVYQVGETQDWNAE